ncbi:hypothetical protein [Haloarcula laminariae]|nr:hypothetical protein [Halomicroarcula sp. FL173]
MNATGRPGWPVDAVPVGREQPPFSGRYRSNSDAATVGSDL